MIFSTCTWGYFLPQFLPLLITLEDSLDLRFPSSEFRGRETTTENTRQKKSINHETKQKPLSVPWSSSGCPTRDVRTPYCWGPRLTYLRHCFWFSSFIRFKEPGVVFFCRLLWRGSSPFGTSDSSSLGHTFPRDGVPD